MFDKSRFLVKYISNQTKCCDPFKLQIPSNTQNQGKVSLYKTLKHIQTHLMTKQNNDIQKKLNKNYLISIVSIFLVLYHKLLI